MKRVVILGRGASGKSTLAARLGDITGIPVVRLDDLFWQPDLVPLPREAWVEMQQRLAGEERWIMDGDLGPHDVVRGRLRRADTVIFLDFSLLRCVWRAGWRSREREDFWRWLLTYRRRHRPRLMGAIADYAPQADLRILQSPRAVRRFLAEVVALEPIPE
jgi:adenylate kinase family enzyme